MCIPNCEAMTLCIWCEQEKPLLIGKKYCLQCQSRSFQECIRCRRPLPEEKYFTLNSHRCNACQRKYLKEKMSSKQSSSSKSIIAADSDDDFVSSASSQDELPGDFKIKSFNKKATVKRQAPKSPRQAPKKRKVQRQEQQSETLKKLLLEWVQDEECLKKILGGKRVAFIPVFL